MLITTHKVKLYALFYTRSGAICSLLYMECSIMLISTDGVTVYAQCYTRSEAICSLLYMK